MNNSAKIFSFFLLMLISVSVFIQEKERIVLISTTKGDMKVKLYNNTPRHRDYFINLIEKGYFDDTLFGRVIQQFIIQGGSQDSRGVRPGTRVGDGDKTMEIPHEIRSANIPKMGALACPRRDVKKNPDKDSDMSMFFIVEGRPYRTGELDTLELVKNVPIKKEVRKKLYNASVKAELDSIKSVNPREFNARVKELNHRIDSVTRATAGSLTFTPDEREAYTTVGGSLHLKNEYTIFGEVIEGLDIVSKICNLETDMNNRPREDVLMKVKMLN